MDKSWIQINDKLDPAYEKGVENFLDYAYFGRSPDSKIPCPCIHCNNYIDHNRAVVEKHLMVRGIKRSYVIWTRHGEDLEDDSPRFDEDMEIDDILGLVNDAVASHYGDDWDSIHESNSEDQGGEADRFLQLLDDAKQELYPGCHNYSKLSFIVTLFHLKTINRWSCKSLDMLLEVLRKSHPEGAKIPKSYHEAKMIIRNLGLGYEKIHACENDCVLFRNEYKDLDFCPNPNCKAPRYKSMASKVPCKILRYFPLKPRLQRLFVNEEIAHDMRWHKEKRVNDINSMRHPADSAAWKNFDVQHASFATDPRNVRLGLASDGFNPFGNMSSAYSIWPVFLVPYNLPPWRCMKDPFIMMSMLIPGPKSPSNDIDVFLQPLIDELKELWDIGVETYDAYTKQKFNLRACLLWTINDFPAYGNLSGWGIRGYKACPVCMMGTTSRYLYNGGKCVYMGHRQFLPVDHKYRREMKAFDGKQDFRSPVLPLSGEDIFDQLCSIHQVEFGKAPNTVAQNKRKQKESGLNWTKRSIFFELPYWKTLLIRHILDIMHIEKNVFDSIFGTIMNIEGKTKDNWKTRKDLMEMGLRPELHLKPNGDNFIIPQACYNLSPNGKEKLCEFLLSVKYPDGFASNISRFVKMKEFHMSRMKSHDCHVFLQRILPLAIRGLLPREVCQVLVEVSDFFRKLCSRTLYLEDLDEMQNDIALILCKLERVFPPSFFDIMVHLMIHLPYEAKIAGPAQYRWMYPFERKMKMFKGYVHNKARPEGCISERYIDEECLTFCSMYLKSVKTKFNRVERNYDKGQVSGDLSVFSSVGHPFGGPIYDKLSFFDLKKIRTFILNNCEEIDDFVSEHKAKLERENLINVNQRHDLEFPHWFEQRVKSMHVERRCSEGLLSLARGPDDRVKRYTGCNVNGFRFHTRSREKDRKTQNSGVIVVGEHENETVDFYGVLTDIIEVEYLLGHKKVLLFKCDWWNTKDASGLKKDKHWNITSVNVSRTWYSDCPFVLASQVEQVFYLKDTKLGNSWYTVERVKPRSFYDVPKNVSCEIDEPYQEEDVEKVSHVQEIEDVPFFCREDASLLDTIDASMVLAEPENLIDNAINIFIDYEDTEPLDSEDESTNHEPVLIEHSKVFDIEIVEDSGRIVGKGAQNLITESGCVIRRYGRYQVTQWSKLDKDDRESLIKMVSEPFNIEGGDSDTKQAIYKQLNHQYRNRRYHLHMHYQKCKTKEDAIRNVPENVPELDWKWLCDYFSSQPFQVFNLPMCVSVPRKLWKGKQDLPGKQDMSERNKANRAKQTIIHTAGTKSFERIRYDKKAGGNEIGPIQLYKATHINKKKQDFVNQQAKKNFVEMETLQKQLNEDGSALMSEEEICATVLGQKSGYIRGRGPGPKPPSKQQKKAAEEAIRRAEEAEKRSEELAKQLDAHKEAHKEEIKSINEKLAAAEKQSAMTNQLLQAFLAKLGAQDDLFVTLGFDLAHGYIS